MGRSPGALPRATRLAKHVEEPGPGTQEPGGRKRADPLTALVATV